MRVSPRRAAPRRASAFAAAAFSSRTFAHSSHFRLFSLPRRASECNLIVRCCGGGRGRGRGLSSLRIRSAVLVLETLAFHSENRNAHAFSLRRVALDCVAFEFSTSSCSLTDCTWRLRNITECETRTFSHVLRNKLLIFSVNRTLY